MKKFLILIVAVFTCLGLGNTFAEEGAPKKPKITITAVNETSITTSENKTFSISAETKIKVNGADAKTADLKAGQRVTVTSADGAKADSIEAKDKKPKDAAAAGGDHAAGEGH
jgi:hypothetical protein